MILSKLTVLSFLLCGVLGATPKFPHEGEFGVSPDGEPWDCSNIPNIITLPKPSEVDFSNPNMIDQYNEIWHCHMLEVNQQAVDLKKLIVQTDRSGLVLADDSSNSDINSTKIEQLVTWAVFDANIRGYGWTGYDKWVRYIIPLVLPGILQDATNEHYRNSRKAAILFM